MNELYFFWVNSIKILLSRLLWMSNKKYQTKKKYVVKKARLRVSTENKRRENR